jgi:cyclic beta-1,2-glucan synthetase
MGSFLLFHRHRVYNPSERAWMGWERKRGKLLDLNRILRREYDSFPVKVGDLSILPDVRFVITLDADTELPRGAAHRLVGTLAHPLNRAIIDPEKNIVVAGYGILQPRVGVSVQSAGQSRLASIFSGETGLDIYSRAVSDVYQDLYDEGSFTGKGIYDVDAVHQVLNDRFPRNSLLSHDLIEGAYARAGLASDIEVIEDYPSHYSAYNRRKHRWLRGDWQITGWLRPRVTDEQGRKVQNPISLLAQWKILDNLRRSLFEPATFLLILLGWFVLPAGPVYWTLVVIGILFVPALCSLVFGLVRALLEWKRNLAREAVNGVFTAYVNVFLTLTFLAHQTLLSLDAVVRTIVRRTFTGQRLLQWETAAEAELGRHRRTPVDVYLDWVLLLALGLAIVVMFVHPQATAAAIPILFLWACSKWIAVWLNRPPYASRVQISAKDRSLLHKTALRTWRYFAEFSTQEHNWLIPDNVQADPLVVAPRVSPTNLGFLLNARQVACEFGYLTLPEFTDQTLKTFSTFARLRRHAGHLLNWYDTRTLAALPPFFVSSVDNGNLVASLWTLQHGCLNQLNRPLLRQSSRSALLDHLGVLFELHALPRRELSRLRKCLSAADWLNCALELSKTDIGKLLTFQKVPSANLEEAHWFAKQLTARLENISRTVFSCLPWLAPEFSALCQDLRLTPWVPSSDTPLAQLPAAVDQLSLQCSQYASSNGSESSNAAPVRRFARALIHAQREVLRLIADLRGAATIAGRFADEMNFRLLLNPHRRMLSAGLDVESASLHTACYDFLASESRTASFVAVAKDDIPQESWFLLGRTHTMAQRRPVLLSWTGTMFEYLMPSLWIRSYANTLLERATWAAVRVQQAYAADRNVPWGISESAYSATDELGNYQYHAFGVPQLALRKRELGSLVVSPYSSFLALPVDPAAAIQNIRKLIGYGCLSSYGFYEAIDFSPAQRRWRQRFTLVRCWMAHHQGMILLSLANFLHDGIVQEWFHADHRVQATELLLHERPVTYVPRRKLQGKVAA